MTMAQILGFGPILYRTGGRFTTVFVGPDGRSVHIGGGPPAVWTGVGSIRTARRRRARG